MRIAFQYVDVLRRPRLAQARLREKIRPLFDNEGVDCKILNINICSDAYLLMLNQKYLQHDYLTDILTFELAKEPLEAELYISLDRIIDNARAFNKTVADEFHRVAIHGALHLCGYLDATQHQKQKMTKLEDYYLSLPSST